MVSAVVALCLSSTLAEIFAFVIAFIQFNIDRHRHFGNKVRQGAELKGVLGMALPLGFSAYVRSILLNVEHIMIPRKLRERGEGVDEAYSHYGTLHGMAIPLVTYPMSPLSSFAGLLVPEFSEDLSAGRVSRMSRIASKALNTTLAYSVVTAVFLFTFSEDLGYTVYHSYDAGYYISTLSLVVPIMYLDHVTDSMLKGLGEQVFSMWVNISDSLLSVILVCVLIPRMGIIGYAVVIVIMEGYNFILSFLRLSSKVRFKIDLIKYFMIPFVSSVVSAHLVKTLFAFGGSSVTPIGLFLKVAFALSVTVALNSILGLYKNKKTVKQSN
jgi:stage V sporulation protein B